ncbi:hypothetical protein RJT34_23742 [Clitoria ternatea]|uniref:Transcription repressor n=1 Tax=Clitoria ternatea TaxID=43366 RepID=A0AAN9FPE9_CLITE
MKFFSRFKNTGAWPSCHQQPRTLSFRVNTATKNDVVSKAVNSTLVEESHDSVFTESPNSRSFSTASEEECSRRGVDQIESVIRGLRSDRLFFEPDETSSICGTKNGASFRDSVVLSSMDSRNPYVDFRNSMEEMVETYGVKDWEGLEELLWLYLKVNEEKNHGYIVGAFVDFLVGFTFANNSSSSPSLFYSSPDISSCSTPCVSCLEGDDETIPVAVDVKVSSLPMPQFNV